MTEMMGFYLKNHDFEVYVNKGCQTYNKSRDEELNNAIVREVYKEMQKGGCNEQRNNGGKDSVCVTSTDATPSCGT